MTDDIKCLRALQSDLSGYFAMGRVEKGDRVASGLAANSPFERGAIEMQRPFFESRGVDMSGLYNGTLNVSIPKQLPSSIAPEFIMKDVKWSPTHQAENFSLTSCQLIFNMHAYPSYVYAPDAETKIGHRKPVTTVEVIAPYIPDVAYGDHVILVFLDKLVSRNV